VIPLCGVRDVTLEILEARNRRPLVVAGLTLTVSLV
jgi:hypothetical protein